MPSEQSGLVEYLPAAMAAGRGHRGRAVSLRAFPATTALRRRSCNTRNATRDAVSRAREGTDQAARGLRGAGGGRAAGGWYRRGFGTILRLRRRVRLSAGRLFCRFGLFSDVGVGYLHAYFVIFNRLILFIFKGIKKAVRLTLDLQKIVINTDYGFFLSKKVKLKLNISLIML